HIADGDSSQSGRIGPPGVELPDGGWIPSQTAAAISAAAGVLWIRRRRRYLPRAPATHRVDPDLIGFPEAVNAILAEAASPGWLGVPAPERPPRADTES